jgi:hypothetical protein
MLRGQKNIILPKRPQIVEWDRPVAHPPEQEVAVRVNCDVGVTGNSGDPKYIRVGYPVDNATPRQREWFAPYQPIEAASHKLRDSGEGIRSIVQDTAVPLRTGRAV